MSSGNHEAFIKMALDAGFESVTVVQTGFADPAKQEIFANGNEVNLTKFAQLVAAHERDACAKLSDMLGEMLAKEHPVHARVALTIGIKIRSRA